MQSIPAGTRAETVHLVTDELVTHHIGSDQTRVLSTPILIGLLEQTARDAVRHLMDENEDTVGTTIELRHTAAAPFGMQVRLSARVSNVTGRRICFCLEASDEAGPIAEGVHERTVIDVSRFAIRAEQRLNRRTQTA